MFVYVIDVGTSSMRGILYNERAEVLMKHSIIRRPEYLGNGRVEEDPADWRDGLLVLLKVLADYCASEGITPDAISLTAQRSSVIPLDKEGVLLGEVWEDCSDILSDTDMPRTFLKNIMILFFLKRVPESTPFSLPAR